MSGTDTRERFVVTISHQLGSGGAAVGRELAEQLGIPFADRQILQKAAENFRMSESDIAPREERRDSFWEAFSRMELLSDPVTAASLEYIPTDRELFETEAKYIAELAAEGPAVILGRCGRFILRGSPRHLSVFLHARDSVRAGRIHERFGMPEKEALRALEKNDRERSRYIETFTHFSWLDARSYDLSIDTSAIPPQAAVELIKTALAARFGSGVLAKPKSAG